jgi:hypothetical protein
VPQTRKAGTMTKSHSLRKTLYVVATTVGLSLGGAGVAMAASGSGGVPATVPAVEQAQVAEPTSVTAVDTDNVNFESESQADDATEAQTPEDEGMSGAETIEAPEAPEATDASEPQFIGDPPGNDQTGNWDGDYNYEG